MEEFGFALRNHNLLASGCLSLVLYLIEFLHQTTTAVKPCAIRFALYLIEFLHQTTTMRRQSHGILSCILLNFYIKPQRNKSRSN